MGFRAIALRWGWVGGRFGVSIMFHEKKQQEEEFMLTTDTMLIYSEFYKTLATTALA